MSAHTPGSWRVSAQYPQHVIQNASNVLFVQDAVDPLRKLPEADVSLIAAAPALLEALENFIKYPNALECTRNIMLDKARAAIAQAKGEG